nr:substrate-binding domain-containing protein [Agromyces mangrovi]
MVSPPRHVFERGGAYAWRFRDGALERAARYGLQLFHYYGESQQPAIERSLNAILDARPSATGLIVHNDASIAALPAVLRERNVSVPNDLSVVSLYPRDFGRTFQLPFTAVETSPDELGRDAIEHLVRRISDPTYAPPVVRFVEPEITNRGSTA